MSDVIDWDGKHLPEALRQLRPGRYVIAPVDEAPELTPEEEQGIIEALAELDAGKGIPWEEVNAELEERIRRHESSSRREPKSTSTPRSTTSRNGARPRRASSVRR